MRPVTREEHDMLILSPELRLMLTVLRYVALGVAIGGTALGLATAQMAAEAFVLVYGLSWAAAHAGLSAQAHAELERPVTPEEAP
jgi:predicted membrane channel-forming protein YqfA (hemolysin III family)